MTRLLRLGLLLFAACFVSEMRAQDLPGSRSFGSNTRTVSGSVVIQGAMVGNVRVPVESASRTFHRTEFADWSGSFSIGGTAADAPSVPHKGPKHPDAPAQTTTST